MGTNEVEIIPRERIRLKDFPEKLPVDVEVIGTSSLNTLDHARRQDTVRGTGNQIREPSWPRQGQTRTTACCEEK